MAKYRKYSIGDEGGEAGLDKPGLGARLCAVRVTVVVYSVQCSVQRTASAAEAAAPGVSKSTFW